MVGSIRLTHHGKTVRVIEPWKFPGIHHDATDRRAMSTHVLGQGMNHDIGPELDRLAQHRSRNRVVHHQRQPVRMRQISQRRQVHDIAKRIPDGLAKNQPCMVVDACLHGLQIIRIDETDFDPQTRQGVRKQVVGAPVQGVRGNNVVATARDGEDCVGDGRHPGGQPQRPDTPFHFGNALLQYCRGRIHDAGVDVALDFEIEQVRPVLRIVESVRRGLVDRHGHRLGGGFRFVAAVHGQGFHLHTLILEDPKNFTMNPF